MELNENGKHVGNFACPVCRSNGKDRKGDNLSIYKQEDGTYDGWCWSCETRFEEDDITHLVGATDVYNDYKQKLVIAKENRERAMNTVDMATLCKLNSEAIKDRFISEETVKKYGVKQLDGKRYYPKYSKGKLIGFKCRKLPKEFDPSKGAIPIGDIKTDEMWGQQLFDKGNGVVIVTEGEEDAMAAHQMTAKHSPKSVGYAAVSLPCGKSSLKKAILNNYDFLNKFEKIIFALDQESEVFESLKEVCKLLPPKKAYISKFDEKDANDMLIKQKDYEFYKAIWNSEQYKPEGIVLGSETWSAWKNRNNYQSIPLPEEWGLNHILQGIRLGGLYTIGAGTGVGKTTMFKILQLHLFNNTEDNIGVIALEEPLCDSVGMLMGLHLRKRIHVDGEVSAKEEKKAWEHLFAENRFVFEQGFGALTESDLFDKIRYMSRVQNCKYIFIDHLTAVTDMFGDGKGSKIEQTARLVAGIKGLTQELDCAIVQISHVRKRGDESKSYEEGAVPGLDSLYGAAAIKQYSDAVITISRDQRLEPSVTNYHVIKNRLSGKLGAGSPLIYDYMTGHLKKSEEIM